ncbi:MAG: hypothetical protein KDA51_03530 [Planctomycetales bacterium]|nr:hypothetical protein [Planctomycetales bacterium]
MRQFSRRSAIQLLGTSALSLALARVGLAGEQVDFQSIDVANWLQQLQENAVKLRERQINPLLWQEAMDSIYRATPLEQLKEHLSFSKLSKAILEKMPADRGEYFHTIELTAPTSATSPSGPEPRQVLITKVARVRKGYSVPPHGHSNMVSAFLCLSGEFDVRLYDRLEEREGSMVVRSTVHQQAAGPGTWSSISDYRDNVHWLTAKSDDCYLFTCKMLSVEQGLPLHGRINIDLKNSKKLNSMTYLAPKITAAEASRLY